jgi:hypothetical protein
MDIGSFPHQVTRLVSGPDDRAFFAADQPSIEVATFGLAPVTQVGVDLDRKLTGLPRALDVPTPPTASGRRAAAAVRCY